MISLKDQIIFPTSTYAAFQTGDALYVGGSDWNRRKITYTKSIANTSKGVLHILEEHDGKFSVERTVSFPSMVYSIVGLKNQNIFIGCKGGRESLNVINTHGDLVISRDDFVGNGVYNAVLNARDSEIILTTRSGVLEVIDIESLVVKEKIQLTSSATRLWSLVFNEAKNMIYAGDYDGVLYGVERNIFTQSAIQKLDFREMYTQDKRIEGGFGPSLWGLELKDSRIIVGTRWGDLWVLSEDFKIQEQIHISEDITCIMHLQGSDVLIGTRYGKLLVVDIDSKEIDYIEEKKPALQKENAVWGMAQGLDGVWACFADGEVCLICYKN